MIFKDGVFAVLRSRFAKYEESITRSYEARSKDRLDSLLSTLAHRRDSEIADMNALLDELEKSIRKELDVENNHEAYVQLTFDFGDEDLQELKRDFAALRARLGQIPEERANETSAIERHYSNPRSLTFPAAVLFLVPETKAWGCH